LFDLTTGTSQIVPNYQHDTDLHPIGDDVWLRWTELGYVARLDPAKGTFTSIDLNADGPLLRSAFIADGHTGRRGEPIWAFGFPVDESLPDIVFRIDPKTVTVTARAWIINRLALVDGTGYTLTADGRVASFDLDEVQGGAPREVVRRDPVSATLFTPDTSDEREVLEVFTRVFDHHVPNAEAAPNLEDATALESVRTQLMALGEQIGPSLKLIVTDISVSDDTASVAYSFMLNDKIAFVPLAGALERVNGEWIVTHESLCRLADQAAISGC
jgi:hypothetical protein